MNRPQINPVKYVYSEFSFFTWLVSSVDIHFYKKLPYFQTKTCLIYLIILVIFTSGLLSILLAVQSNRILGEITSGYDARFPVLEFQNYQLVFDSNQPKSSIFKGFQVIIDPTQKITQLDSLIQMGVILYRDELTVFLPENQTRVFKYQSLGLTDIIINQSTLKEMQPVMVGSILVIGSGIRFLLTGMTKAIEILMASMLLGILADLFNLRLPGYQRFNIAMTAIVPPIILETIAETIGFSFSGFFSMYILIYGVFLSFGIFALSSKVTQS